MDDLLRQVVYLLTGTMIKINCNMLLSAVLINIFQGGIADKA